MLDMPAASCSCIVDSGKRRSVRITLEVTPALNVRMSIRFAGPHFETKNNQDHAANSPRSISVAALSQRSLLVPSFISVHSENPPGFALSALQAYTEANHRGMRRSFHVYRHLHPGVIRTYDFIRPGFGRRGPLGSLFLTGGNYDFLKSGFRREHVVVDLIRVF